MTVSTPNGRRCAVLCIAAGLSACASVTPPPGTLSQATSNELAKSFADSLTAVNASLAHPQTVAANPAVARDFVAAGMGLSDLQCKAYFKNLGLAAQHYAYARKELGLTGGLVSGLEGLTGVSAKAIAITSSMFSFGIASTENYADVFFFSPDISGLQELVEGAQRAYRGAMPSLNNLSYGAAVGLLRDYDKLCEVQTIRRLVNESVTTARFETNQGVDAVVTVAERSAVARAIGEPVVTSNQVAAIYWLVLGAPTAADKTVIAAQLKGLPFFFDASGALQPLSATDLAALKRVLAPIAERSEDGLDGLVAALRAPPPPPGEEKSLPRAGTRGVGDARYGASIGVRIQR